MAVVVLGLVMVASSCGSDGSEAASSTTSMGDMGSSEMPMGSMNMGDADATRASDVEGAEIEQGTFELLDTRPQGYDDVAGDAAIARYDGGTTITIEVSGLMPGESYIAHLHESPCSDNGGNHYKFDPNGSDMPPNEIHLAFVADPDGNGFMTAENDQTAGPDGVAVVVHPVDLLDNKIACADFDE